MCGRLLVSHAYQWYQKTVTCMSVVPTDCHMHVSGTNRLSHACQWYQQTVTCMSVIPTDLNFSFKNYSYIYQHVLRQVILWPLYFMGGNDGTPHYRCRRNSVLFSTLKFPEPNVIFTTAAGYI